MGQKNDGDGVTLVYNLTESSRTQVLRRFAPRFSCVMADHITYQSGAPDDAPLPPAPQRVQIIGYQADEALEALVVEIDGTTQRLDGGTYHITLSLEPEQRQAQDSNHLLKEGWDECEPLRIEITPGKNS